MLKFLSLIISVHHTLCLTKKVDTLGKLGKTKNVCLGLCRRIWNSRGIHQK
jgi:hypothetical protein